jgi:hypothetical protein
MEFAPWAEPICSVTDAVLVELAWLVAVTVTGVVAETLGAVNSPVELIVPAVADQVTAWFVSTTAKVTWSTAVPADSQVEYRTTAAYGTITALASAKVAAHSVSITALTGGTAYHFRVRSSDSNGVLMMGPDYSLTITLPVSITLSPQSATVAANGTQRFNATVSNVCGRGADPGLCPGALNDSYHDADEKGSTEEIPEHVPVRKSGNTYW